MRVCSLNLRSSYTGNFRRGARHGLGEYVWPDGSKFAGQWWDNKPLGSLYVSIGLKWWLLTWHEPQIL